MYVILLSSNLLSAEHHVIQPHIANKIDNPWIVIVSRKVSNIIMIVESGLHVEDLTIYRGVPNIILMFWEILTTAKM